MGSIFSIRWKHKGSLKRQRPKRMNRNRGEIANGQGLLAGARVMGFWEQLARRDILFSESDAPPTEYQWRELIDAASQPSEYSTPQLLRSVTGYSSMDRDVETPVNTLTPSVCWLAMHPKGKEEDLDLAMTAQIECGCEIGDACYWSSTPSSDPTTQDFIDYEVDPYSLVRMLQVIPYGAVWHPNRPTYAPRAVSFHIFSTSNSTQASGCLERELLLVSPLYPLENKMQLNEFILPQPVWLPWGGTLRLNMYGRHQAETVDGPSYSFLAATAEALPQYYACLSYVSAVGVSGDHRLLPATRAGPQSQQSMP